MKIELETLGVEFTFDSRIKNSSERVDFYRKLYGCRRSSYYGKYTYIKEGILSEINYIKPTYSTIIVSIKDSEKLRKFFRKYNVLFDERVVILDEKDAKKLGLNHSEGWKKIYEEIKGNPDTFFYLDF